jgi:hypothetical protein
VVNQPELANGAWMRSATAGFQTNVSRQSVADTDDLLQHLLPLAWEYIVFAGE